MVEIKKLQTRGYGRDYGETCCV